MLYTGAWSRSSLISAVVDVVAVVTLSSSTQLELLMLLLYVSLFVRLLELLKLRRLLLLLLRVKLLLLLSLSRPAIGRSCVSSMFVALRARARTIPYALFCCLCDVPVLLAPVGDGFAWQTWLLQC